MTKHNKTQKGRLPEGIIEMFRYIQAEMDKKLAGRSKKSKRGKH